VLAKGATVFTQEDPCPPEATVLARRNGAWVARCAVLFLVLGVAGTASALGATEQWNDYSTDATSRIRFFGGLLALSSLFSIVSAVLQRNHAVAWIDARSGLTLKPFRVRPTAVRTFGWVPFHEGELRPGRWFSGYVLTEKRGSRATKLWIWPEQFTDGVDQVHEMLARVRSNEPLLPGES